MPKWALITVKIILNMLYNFKYDDSDANYIKKEDHRKTNIFI